MNGRLFRCCALLLLVVALISGGRHLHAAGLFDPATIQAYLHQRPLYTACLFVALYAIFVLSFVPTLPLNLAAGLLWGGALGGILVAFGATLGATAAFLAARTVLGPLVLARIRWADRLKNDVERLGWLAVAFCRLNPAIPTCVVNYAFGITSLPLRTYLWATFVFFLPATLAIAVIGEQSQTLIVSSSASGLVDAAVASLAAVAVLLGIAWMARRWNSAKREMPAVRPGNASR